MVYARSGYGLGSMGSRDPVDFPREVEVKIGDPALGVIVWAIGNADRTERLARLIDAVRGEARGSEASGRQEAQGQLTGARHRWPDAFSRASSQPSASPITIISGLTAA
jgi:hypothetical protein